MTCQICFEPMLFEGERFCTDCWIKINKRLENKFKKIAIRDAIKEVTLETRHKQYQDRLKEIEWVIFLMIK